MEKKPRAAILYLASSLPKYVSDLKLSLASLDKNFNDQFKYPVIIFHRDFSEELMQEVRNSTSSDVHFEKIIFELPDFLRKEDVPEFYLGYDMEYRHMCRFFSGPMYLHSSLKDYDWYWRFDTDSFLTDKIDYDVFRFMEDNKYLYGYMTILNDHPKMVFGLWDVVKKYIKKNKIKPVFLKKYLRFGKWNRSLYYVNFEIGSLNFWRSEEFVNYFNYIDRSGGIYKYRWGDTAIRSLAIFMFMPEIKTFRFKDIGYKHQSFVQSPKFSLSNFFQRQIFYYLHKWYWIEPFIGRVIRFSKKIFKK